MSSPVELRSIHVAALAQHTSRCCWYLGGVLPSAYFKNIHIHIVCARSHERRYMNKQTLHHLSELKWATFMTEKKCIWKETHGKKEILDFFRLKNVAAFVFTSNFYLFANKTNIVFVFLLANKRSAQGKQTHTHSHIHKKLNELSVANWMKRTATNSTQSERHNVGKLKNEKKK